MGPSRVRRVARAVVAIVLFAATFIAIAGASSALAQERTLVARAGLAQAPPRAPTVLAPPPRRVDPLVLEAPSGQPVHVYPSRADAAAPLLVMLHGMCSDPAAECSLWQDSGRALGTLVCPAGNSTCGARPDWRGSGAEKAAYLDGILERVRAAEGLAAAGPGGDVLVGWSRGAFVARDVVYERPGRYRGLVLLGASMSPDPARFRAAGIRRVVMGAGDFDGARLTMQRAAVRLRAGGVETRWVGLGPVPHQLPRDLDRILAGAIAWITEPS